MSFSGGGKDFCWSFPSCSGKIGGWCFEIRKKFLALLIFGKKSPESSYDWAFIRGLGRTHYIDSEILIR